MSFPTPQTIATQIKTLALLDTTSAITTGKATEWDGADFAAADLPAIVVLPGAGRYQRADAGQYLVTRAFLLTLYVSIVPTVGETVKIQATVRQAVLPYLTSIPAYWAQPKLARLSAFTGVMDSDLDTDTGVDITSLNETSYSAAQWVMTVTYRVR